jgi:hypothetical protein
MLENLENNNDFDRTKLIDLNICCLQYSNNKNLEKSERIKLKNIIDFCFIVLLLIDSNKLDSLEIIKSIKTKALYLKLDLLFDVKEDPSNFADITSKILS